MGFVAKKIIKDGTPRYYAVYITPTGKKQWEAAGKLRKSAEALLKRREQEIAQGTYGKLRDISFDDFSKKWLSDYASMKVKPSTYDDYSGIVRKHLRPFFGKSLLNNITTGEIQGFVSHKLKEGLSPRTVNKTIMVLKMMFKHAEVWGYTKDNPARFVERPRVERKEMDYLTPEEIRKFLDAAFPEDYPLFATAVLTGARQGELLGLKWSDLDLDKGMLCIRRTYSPNHGFMEPKSRKGWRTVLLTPELVNILLTHKIKTGGDPDELIFNDAKNPIIPHNMVRDHFHPTLRRAGIRRIRFHDLRHTYATLMISLGENTKLLQQQLGHSSITTTMDRYGHLLPEVSEGVGKRIDSLVFSKKVESSTTEKMVSEENFGRTTVE